MLDLIAAPLLVLARVPAPKMQYERAPSEMPYFQFEVEVFEIMKRAQLDQDYATVDLDNYNPHATFYFKGDAKARLARYTLDPRIDAVSVPLSAAELGKVSSDFMTWVNRRGFAWEHAGADPKTGTVRLGSRNPAPILAAAKAEGISLDRIAIYDSTPHYVNERG
jgi:hypothetical protein